MDTKPFPQAHAANHAPGPARIALPALAFALAMLIAVALPGFAQATQSRAAQFVKGYAITGVTAQDMLAVAAAQEGRTQKSLGYTEGWCADFVSDCAKALGQDAAVPFNGVPSALKKAVISAGGTVVSSPKPGDLVFFGGDHVGIMSDAENCISGNMGSPSKVSFCKVEWVIPGSKVVYVRPAYRASAYKVAFKANGGTGKMPAQTIKRDAATALNPVAFTQAGFAFTGWNTKKDGSGKAFADAQKVKNLGGTGATITLYAQWQKASYKVAFKANGGVGKMTSQEVKRGKSKALKANAFKRAGYKFVGWNTKKDGTGKAYKNKQKVKNLAKPGKTVKLYAQWKKKAK